eukprot:scaffold223402_cov28-Tisochrysis_lutea.AAC.6
MADVAGGSPCEGEEANDAEERVTSSGSVVAAAVECADARLGVCDMLIVTLVGVDTGSKPAATNNARSSGITKGALCGRGHQRAVENNFATKTRKNAHAHESALVAAVAGLFKIRERGTHSAIGGAGLRRHTRPWRRAVIATVGVVTSA